MKLVVKIVIKENIIVRSTAILFNIQTGFIFQKLLIDGLLIEVV